MLLPDGLEPQLLSQVYWKQKKAFLLDEDTYEEWALFAVTEGRFYYKIGGEEGEAEFGHLVMCPPGTPFGRQILEPLSFHFYRFDWNMPPAGPLPVLLPLMDRTRLASTYSYLEKLSARPADEVKTARMDHLLKDLWLMAQLEAETAHSKQRGYAETDSAIEAAARTIRQHAFERMMFKPLSEGMGLSPVQFTRRFQAAYGQSPIDYLTSLRLQKAQSLLLESELTIEQIAEQCGYENGFYFSRMFSKKMKVSPSAYRKSHRI
jgi:AraC family transcriptional regulator